MDTTIQVLEIAIAATKAVPVAGHYLESILGTALQIAKTAERAKSNKEDCQLLARRAAAVAGAIANKVMRMEVEQVANLNSDIEALLRTLERTWKFSHKLSELSILSRIRSYSKINAELKQISCDFQDALNIFGINSQLHSGVEMAHLRIALEGIQRSVDSVAAMQKSESLYDGDFMLLRSSDIIIQKELRRLQGEDSVTYLVTLRTTNETLVMKRYSRRDAAYNLKLKLLRDMRLRFSHVEQLIGYSRSESTPFYVTHTGRTDVKSCMTNIRSMEQLRHVVTWTHEIQDTVQSLQSYMIQLYGKIWHGEIMTCMITSRTTNLGAVRQGDIIPSTLYFFEYPHVEIGPPHVAWGYWSSDEEGNNTSTVTSCYYDRETGDGARWSLQLKLDGLTFMMSRFTVLDYAALTDDLVTLIRDGHAEDQNDDGSNGGINEENRGSEDGSEDDYVDAQDFFS
ncbi:hypothetical protein PUNSTDRAFT_128901 [Punctularia strigosozonata HHB-11173 SS5]|uniref:uncharacterized protein n=1 Tax=Punctularia strigosozonata (strain HHB-11173) TaxID=741275 RepID=UPI0004416DB1|nr:uncharacterized protein PUNSTDRAFT_128901 [Punctularia strigosozonata HHB-11173 SS5]EIN13211.1 hypothetical protein PUNSTDRAFT_128901 [Punctularia strigosozonata HHB-11173 SS5]